MQRLMVIVAVLLFLGAAPARAEVPINALVEQAKAFDGKTITIEGEVIGDVMVRGEYGWINISDGTNDLGVRAPASALQKVTHVGRYFQTGDRVRVTGQFRRADPEFGGDLLIRADSVEITAAGSPVAHPVPAGRPVLTAVALGLAGVLGLLQWLTKRTGRA